MPFILCDRIGSVLLQPLLCLLLRQASRPRAQIGYGRRGITARGLQQQLGEVAHTRFARRTESLGEDDADGSHGCLRTSVRPRHASHLGVSGHYFASSATMSW